MNMDLPDPAVANTFLQRNSDNTAYVAKNVAETRDALDIDFHGNVKWSGAVGDGVANDAAVFQAAATAGGVWEVPSGKYKLGSSITVGQPVYWEGGKVLNAAGNAPIPLPGVQELWFADSGKFIYEPVAKADTYSTFRVDRRASYAGGSPSRVASAVKVLHTVDNAGVADFQWALTSVMDNSATGGENVGIYAQGIKRAGAGPTWALCVDAKSKAADPTSGMIGAEIAIFGWGTDANGLRVIADIIGGHDSFNGAPPGAVITYGVRIGTWDGDTITNGVHIKDSVTTGINLAQEGTRGINFTAGSKIALGIDFSSATFASGSAIRLNRGQNIDFEPTSTLKMNMTPATNILKLLNGATEVVGFDFGVPGVRVSGTKVIGPRETGWTAGTGTALKGAFAAYAGVAHTGAYVQATIQALDDAARNASQRVRAIEAALRTHGLIN